MKTTISVRRGFTLIEVLVVITIIAILSALTSVGLSYVTRKKNEEASKLIVQNISKNLDEFLADNGYLPDGDGTEKSTNGVYMALYGDDMNAGVPTENKKTKEKNKVYYAELDPNVRSNTARLTIKLGGKFVIIDPWGQAFRYRLGFRHKDEKGKEGTGVNPDFDVWSVGVDGKTTQGEKKTGVDADNLTNW